MVCKCGSERIAEIGAKCSDCCGVKIGTRIQDGYVPRDLGVGGGDYVEFKWCLDCGQIQGVFPLPKSELEKPRLCMSCEKDITHADPECILEVKSNIYCEDCA